MEYSSGTLRVSFENIETTDPTFLVDLRFELGVQFTHVVAIFFFFEYRNSCIVSFEALGWLYFNSEDCMMQSSELIDDGRKFGEK